MGRTAYWIKDNLYWLLNEDIGKLDSRYPRHDRNKLTALRRYHLNKLKKDPTYMPPKPEGEPTPEPIGKLYKTWEVSAYNTETQEFVTTTNHGYEYSQTPEDQVDNLFPQVESSVIRPTKRRRKEDVGYEEILGYGDGQVDFRLIRDPRTVETRVVPLHNVEMHRIILQMNAYYQPNRTINGGDFGDFAAFSRFPADSDHFTGSSTLAMQWIHDFYSQVVADNPNELFGGTAIHSEVASNHTDRPRRKVLKEMPEMYNFYRPGEDYPAWTYPSMAKLGELGIDVKSGYPHGGIVTGEQGYPQVLWKHGDITAKNAVAREAEQNPSINVIRWHNHREQYMKQTSREGNQMFYLVLGSSCLNGSTVPGYHSSVDDFNEPVEYHNQGHVNSFLWHRDYGQGRYENATIDVVNGKAYFDKMEWDGSEPYEWEHKYGYVKENDNE